jgi:hypothetical protein
MASDIIRDSWAGSGKSMFGSPASVRDGCSYTKPGDGVRVAPEFPPPSAQAAPNLAAAVCSLVLGKRLLRLDRVQQVIGCRAEPAAIRVGAQQTQHQK